MHVVATAGHVDHGKSTLVRALTGMEPDRLAEEARRGLTLDLGFAWTTLTTNGSATCEQVAFVDVPGHARFVTTMLAGIGPVPVVLFVVAADAGWMPQSSEHLDALDALGVRHGLLVLTRTDLADAAQLAAARAQAAEHLAPTSLAGIGVVDVSARTGHGLDDLRAALAALLRGVEPSDPLAPVRLWVDRAFTINGAGTVVTGTLPAGRIAVGDELVVGAGDDPVTVRGVQALGEPVREVTGVARVALNLRGVPASDLRRGDTLTTPGSFWTTSEVDVALHWVGLHQDPLHQDQPTADHASSLPEQLVLHLGSAAAAVRVRPLGPAQGSPRFARLRLPAPLALRIGDVGLLRDPGAHRIVAGLRLLDVAPPPLTRRGAAARRSLVLAATPTVPDAAGELIRRGVVRAGDLIRFGVPEVAVQELSADRGAAVAADGWLVSAPRARDLARALREGVEAAGRERPLEPGLALEVARQQLSLPTTGLVRALAGAAGGGDPSPLAVHEGRVVAAADARRSGPPLPPAVVAAAGAVLADAETSPFAAPDADRLRALALGPRELAALVRAGSLVRLAPGVYLPPASVEAAAAPLARLDQPFTASAARGAWATSRRVALPLLELLDRRGLTRRLPDDRRVLVEADPLLG